MTTAVNAIMSLVLIAAGYVYACYYLNGVGWKEKNTAVLSLNRNKVIYLLCAALTSGVLIILFQTLYALSWMQSTKLLCLVLVLFPAAAIDMRVQRIPNKLLLAAFIARCVLLVIEFAISPAGGFAALKDGVIGAVVLGVFFLLLLLLFKNSIGMGDVKLFAMMGLYQGLWGAVNAVFFSLMASFFQAVFLLLTRKKTRKDTVSFGPSILIGTVIAIALAGM
ncbi:MAG: prepilin peptidase [Ruminococcaceae bacterium]|nr:prepilin peptidase [Oscillospiraceae bacterium]